MKFNCPQCQIAYELPDVDLSVRPNAQLRCRKCLTLFAIADALKQAAVSAPTASNGVEVPEGSASATTAPVAPAPPVVGAVPRPIPRPGEVHSKLPQVSVGASAVGLGGSAVGFGGAGSLGAGGVTKRTSVPPVVNLTPVAVPKPRGSAAAALAGPVGGGLSTGSLSTSGVGALAARSASRAPMVAPLVDPGQRSATPATEDKATGAPSVNGKGTHTPWGASGNSAPESQPPPASHVPALPPLGNLNAGKPAVRVSMPVRLTGSPLAVPPPSENPAVDQWVTEPPLVVSAAPVAPLAVAPVVQAPVVQAPVAAAPVVAAPVASPTSSAPESTRSRDAAARSVRGPGVAPPLPTNAFAHQAPATEAAQVRAATTVLGLVSPTTLAAAQHAAAAPPPPEQFATALGQALSAEPTTATANGATANGATANGAQPNGAAAYAFPLMGGAPALVSAPPSDPPQVYDSLPPDAMDSVPAAADGAAAGAARSDGNALQEAAEHAAFTPDSVPTSVVTAGAAPAGVVSAVPVMSAPVMNGALSAAVAVQGAQVDNSGQQSLVATWGQNGLSFPPAAAVPVVPSSLPAAAPSYAPSRAALDSFPELRRKKGVPALAAVVLCLVFAGGGFAAGRLASPVPAPATAANNPALCTDKALAARGEAPPPPPPAAPAAEQTKPAEPEQAAADVAPEGPSVEETVDESPSNGAKEGRVRKSVASNASPTPAVDEAAAASSGALTPAAAANGSAGGGLLAGLGTPEAAGPKTQETASPPPAGGGLSAAEIQKTVAQNQTGVRQACWQKALAGSSMVAARSARVSVTVQIAPSGGVISVTHGPDPAGYPGLANCVTARVRGWRFARAGANTTANIPFVFAAQ